LVTGRCQVATVTAEGRDPSMGVFMVRRPARLAALAAVALLAPMVATLGASTGAAATGDDTPVLLHPKGEIADEFNGVDEAGNFDKLRDAYYESRLLSGDHPISLQQAAQLRRKGIKSADKLATVGSKKAPGTVGGAWASVGPDPTVQVGRTTNSLQAVSGRIGALAVRTDGSIILGAAQGGVWTYSETSKTWTSRTKDLDTQSVGALAVAPSDDKVVYLGSGEGALSGDSYYGDGVYRSADGGLTWSHVSGTFFQGMSSSDIVVDPADANHLYLSTLRGRGGARRTTPANSQPFGVYESTDGGATWTARKVMASEIRGATDLVMDPANSHVLWASFWGDKIYRSVDSGQTWDPVMTGLPAGNFDSAGTRFSLGISHPAGAPHATVYTGFDRNDPTTGAHVVARVYKTVDDGATWTQTGEGGPASNSNSILDYCTTQCFYDNVLAPDPVDPNIVYVEGSYGYDQAPGTGGIYRSTDGGATWKNLGLDLHPDFHAFAFDPSDSKHIVIGNDGGVWQSHNRGGRLAAGSSLSTTDWENLNGTVDPATGALVHSTGLRIAQFVSAATVPTVAGRYWGGTQDNGTQRKSTANDRWFDQPSGDGGQVLVDPTNEGYVFGTYYAISPYRFTPDSANSFFGNEPIDGGIDTSERAEFYVPWVMNKSNPNQLFLGTYRLYRTDNAEAQVGGDVHWDPISGDLTTGCTGTAPNGARGCFISAVGVADGGDAVYTGSDDGKVFVNEHAVSAPVDVAKDAWTDVTHNLPNRPVTQIAVDRSNWRIAYLSYAGFTDTTPNARGHVYKTTNGGGSWTDISAGLPDVPTNSVVLDPSYPNTLYAGTDIGTFVTTNGGSSWSTLGTAMPKVAAWQLDFDSSRRLLLDGTHGRGAYTISDSTAAPALIVSKTDAGVPVGPGSNIDYTVTVRNVGNAPARAVQVADPVPAHTSFVSVAEDNGRFEHATVTWSGVQIPAGGSVSLHFTVRIDSGLAGSVHKITNDGITVTANGGFGTTGSPHDTPIAPAHGVSIDPADQSGGAKAGSTVNYKVHVINDGYQSDSFSLAATGAWTSTVLDSTCTTPLSVTATLSPGDSAEACVKVTAAADATEGQISDTTLTATSVADPSVSGSGVMHTYAATTDTLLVDEDGSTTAAGDTSTFYKDALTAAGSSYAYWDLKANPVLPGGYLNAHKNVVWYTGNAYPAPLAGYERELTAFLDGGGRLMMSGQDILDQAAGTTPFVQNYLHIAWDGSEVQNDKATADVTGVAGNPVTDGIGAVPLDHSVLGANFEDQITPTGGAQPAFTDDSSAPDALTFGGGGYKVAFLAFPFEAYGTAAQKADLMTRTLDWFVTP
jgi:uncharacterized repeat protein (TIGR01451 family)